MRICYEYHKISSVELATYHGTSLMTFWLLKISAAPCRLFVGIGSPAGVYESQITFIWPEKIQINPQSSLRNHKFESMVLFLTKMLLPPRKGSLKIAWGLKKGQKGYEQKGLILKNIGSSKGLELSSEFQWRSYYKITSLSSPGACPVLDPS